MSEAGPTTMAHHTPDGATITIHAHRLKFLGVALFFAVFVAIGFLMYIDSGPPPPATSNPWAYQEPFQALMSVAVVLLCGTASLAGFYWAATPVPLLVLSPTALLYHSYPLFPFVKQTVYWNDITSIIAKKIGSRVELTLWITTKPYAVGSSDSKPERRLTLRQSLLPLSGDELIHLLSRYHGVMYWSMQSGRITNVRLLGPDHDVTYWRDELDGM